MGRSTDAMVFFGYCFEGENRPPWVPEDEDDPGTYWEDLYAKALGISSRETRMKQAAVEASVCTVVMHCSSEYVMYAVAIKHTHITANRGYPVELVDPKAFFNVNANWYRILDDFCTKLGIPIPKEPPKWWLASDEG